MKKCRIPLCSKPSEYDSGLCGGHHGAWGRSGELKRAEAALQDFVNRTEAEERAGEGGVAIPAPASTKPEELPKVLVACDKVHPEGKCVRHLGHLDECLVLCPPTYVHGKDVVQQVIDGIEARAALAGQGDKDE